MPERALKVLGSESRALREARDHPPERGRHELLDLPLPVRDQAEGRGLDPPRGEDVPAVPARGHGEEPRQHGAPREVHRLPHGGGLREPLVEVREPAERLHELPAGERGEPRAPHGHRRDRVHGPHRLEPDQLPLAVVVRRHHDLVDPLRGPPQRVHPGRVRRHRHGLRVDQGVEVRAVPVVPLGRVVQVHEVAAEREHPPRVPCPRELELAHAVGPEPLDRPFRQCGGQAEGRAELLRDEEPPQPVWSSAMLLLNTMSTRRVGPPVYGATATGTSAARASGRRVWRAAHAARLSNTGWRSSAFGVAS